MSDDVVVPQTLAEGDPELEGPTAGPWVIADGAAKLAAKYVTCGRATCWKSLDYDLYEARRGAEQGWRDRIEGADLYATLLMNSRLMDTQMFDLMARIDPIERALASLPDRDLADLTDTEMAGLFAPLRSLFSAARGHGIALPKITKLLWLKRPNLLPILDREVIGALEGWMWSGRQGTAEFAEDALYALRRFRALLLHEVKRPDGTTYRNVDVVDAIRASVGPQVAAHLQTRGIDPPHPPLPRVRVLESLLWFEWWGYEYFGYRYDRATRAVVCEVP